MISSIRLVPHALVLNAIVLLGAATSHAQESVEVHPYLDSKVVFDAGVYFADSMFRIKVDGSLGVAGETFDFEEQLRTDMENDIANFEVLWRFGEKWSLRAQYLKWDDKGSRTLQEDVVWGDITFGAGTGIAAGTDLGITRLFFGRRFQSPDRHQFGAGFGVHQLDIGAFIAGQAIINDEPVGARRESAKTSGILPNLGGWYMYSMSPRWALTTRVDWLGAEVDKYDGHIINAAVGINFRVFEHVGVGINYNFLELDVDVDEDLWNGSLTSQSDGVFLHLSAYF